MRMRRTRLLKKGAGKGQEHDTRKCSGVHLDKKSEHLDRCDDGVDLHVVIPAELHERLINFIMRRHGGRIPKGAKKATVVELLTLALDQLEHTHKSTRPVMVATTKLWKDMAICDQIMLELANMGLQAGQEVHHRVLAAAIKNVRGFDPRTIKRWRERLRELGYIKPSRKPNFWVITSIPGDENGTQT